MLPGPSEGYKVLEAPPGYEPIRTPARKLMATPTPYGGTPLYQIPEEDRCACLLGTEGACWTGGLAGNRGGLPATRLWAPPGCSPAAPAAAPPATI